MFEGFFYPNLQEPISDLLNEHRVKEVRPEKLRQLQTQLLLIGYDEYFFKRHKFTRLPLLSVLYQPLHNSTWYFDLGLFNEIEGIWPDRNFTPTKNKQ